MKKAALDGLNDLQLVEAFLAACLENFAAMIECDVPKQNRCVERRCALERELQARQGDGRRFLIPYLTHPNIEVRARCAHATVTIARKAAVAILQDVASWGFNPPAADARARLTMLDEPWAPSA